MYLPGHNRSLLPIYMSKKDSALGVGRSHTYIKIIARDSIPRIKRICCIVFAGRDKLLNQGLVSHPNIFPSPHTNNLPSHNLDRHLPVNRVRRQ